MDPPADRAIISLGRKACDNIFRILMMVVVTVCLFFGQFFFQNGSTGYNMYVLFAGTLVVGTFSGVIANMAEFSTNKRQWVCFSVFVALCIVLIVTFQTCKLSHAPPCKETPTVPNTFWAQLMLPAEDPTLPSKAVAFRVTPAIPDIDGLKKAVKAEVPEKLVGIASIDLKVYAHDATTGKWVEVTEPWAPLAANTGETAYHVLVVP